MDNYNDPKRRVRQKAIDGILHGDSHPVEHSAAPVRGRFKGLRPSVTKSTKPVHPVGPQLMQSPATPKPEQRLATPNQNPLSVISAPEVMIDPVKSERTPIIKAKKQRFAFFRHPLRTIRSWSWRKRIVWLLITFVIIGALGVGYLFVKGYFNARKVFKGGGSSVALQENVDPNLLKGEGSGRINILLLGIGGTNHDGPDLTDTILIASIDPVNHKTALLSIPRDMWVQVPGHGSMKINAAYETGKYGYLGHDDASNSNQAAIDAGFASADSAIENVTGITINYHMLVNFQAFKQAIDTVGGITLNVPTALYDPTFASENGGSSLIAAAGTQTFNGTKALMYVRSRHTSSDFARSERQRAVIIALEQKIFTLGVMSNPAKISSLIDAFGSNVVTDLSLSNVTRLYSITKQIPEAQIQSVGLTDVGNVLVTTGMISGQSVVYPLAGLNNYTAIQSFVRSTLRDGYLAKENARVVILNGTSNTGAATAASTVLKSYGYNVTSVGDAPTLNYTKTTIIDLTKGKDPYTAHYLKDRFKVSSVATKLPDQTIQAQNADFVIILGTDETTNS
ncbi:MAG: LCP family protein [Candidatus Saccharibacteria bacterium]